MRPNNFSSREREREREGGGERERGLQYFILWRRASFPNGPILFFSLCVVAVVAFSSHARIFRGGSTNHSPPTRLFFFFFLFFKLEMADTTADERSLTSCVRYNLYDISLFLRRRRPKKKKTHTKKTTHTHSMRTLARRTLKPSSLFQSFQAEEFSVRKI